MHIFNTIHTHIRTIYMNNTHNTQYTQVSRKRVVKRDEIAKFLEHATLLRGIEHPNIQPVLRVSVEDNCAPLVIYPLVEYGNLHDTLLFCRLTPDQSPLNVSVGLGEEGGGGGGGGQGGEKEGGKEGREDKGGMGVGGVREGGGREEGERMLT